MLTRVPLPMRLRMSMSPPCRRTRPLTMDKPSPVPPWRRSYDGAGLKVRLANARQIVFVDADAVVLDDESNVSRLCGCAKRDLAATIREADGIGEQIEQDLIERALVGDHFRKLGGRHFFEGNARLAWRATPKGRSKRP